MKNADKHIERLLGNIQSLENVINDMQSHIESVHESHQELKGQVIDSEGTPSPDMEQQMEDIKGHVSAKVNHIEHLVTHALDADRMQRKFNKMKLLEERINHWNQEK